MHILMYILSHRNMLAAATPYFHAMFTSGLIESEFDERFSRGAEGGKKNAKQKQKLVLQGIEQSTLKVSIFLHCTFTIAYVLGLS